LVVCQTIKDTAWLLYDTALLESGFHHDDVKNFTSRVLKVGVGGQELGMRRRRRRRRGVTPAGLHAGGEEALSRG
jgi:hypothetical protein